MYSHVLTWLPSLLFLLLKLLLLLLRLLVVAATAVGCCCYGRLCCCSWCCYNGIQLSTQSKGRGKIRQDAALRMIVEKLFAHVGGAARKQPVAGSLRHRNQLQRRRSLCVAGTPATSCWHGEGGTLKHVDSNDVGLGFVAQRQFEATKLGP